MSTWALGVVGIRRKNRKEERKKHTLRFVLVDEREQVEERNLVGWALGAKTC